MRLHVDTLYRSQSLMEYLEKWFSGRPEIITFRINILTGNVLIFYNSGASRETIVSALDEALASVPMEIQRHPGSSFNLRKFLSEPSKGTITIPLRASDGNGVLKKDRRGVTKRRVIRKLLTAAETQTSSSWHTMTDEEVLAALESSPSGLSAQGAGKLLVKYGPNLLPESVPRSAFSIFVDQFKSLPVYLLGIAAGISVVTGGLLDAALILGVITINAVIGYTTESQAEKTINSLKSMVRPKAMVLRDGLPREMDAEGIVPGDLILLRHGSYITADARLMVASHLSIDESILTGESMPSSKNPQQLETEGEIALGDRSNMVYMGTLVTGGQGIAVVTATGKFTEIGRIQTMASGARPPKTPMERQLDDLGKQLVTGSLIVCGFVFVIGLLRGHGLLQMLKTSISLAVAAVPEGLPAVATTTLAIGVRSMRRHNVLIRHLAAVETLGSVQTICLDKTGTLTLNRMSVVAAHVGMRRLNVERDHFIEETPTNGSSLADPYDCPELLGLLHVVSLCNESEVTRDGDTYAVNGSPTENALLRATLGAGIDVMDLRGKYPLESVLHRSDNHNYMISCHRAGDGHKTLVAVKGSPSEILPACSLIMEKGNVRQLTDEERELVSEANERMAGETLRVLGVAYATVDETTATEENSCEIENLPAGLIWLGLIGMVDPVREGVRDIIGGFHDAGINTIMITGDQSPTAYAIGKELDLANNGQIEILDSTQFTNIDPDLLQALCQRVHIFSRVSPAHKLQIVQALQNTPRIVAMTGDGINDSPALKAADIGIAMGTAGTDVAREVADVVLEDDRLETMIIAIGQGRTIYNNIRKSLHYLLSTNFSETIVTFVSVAVGGGQPLNTMQLLWINLISDIFPGLALSLEAPEPDVLARPPRDPGEPIIRPTDIKRMAFESATLSAGALAAYGYGTFRYGPGPQATTMAFSSLAFAQIIHALSCRSDTRSAFDRSMPPNHYLTAAIGGTLLLQIAAMTVPGLKNLLGITPIGIADGIAIASTAALPLVINESTKKAFSDDNRGDKS